MDTDDQFINDFDQLSELAEAGKFQEALEKHIWFHEASREMPGMGGVRLSYALDIWLGLAKKHEPAMKALVDLRDKNKKLLLDGKGGFDNFHDLSALNLTLENVDDTFKVFIEIHNDYPEQAKNYFHVVEDLLVERKAYDICEQYLQDPVQKYFQIEHLHKTNIELTKSNPELDSNDFKEYTEQSFVNGVCQLIEILIALKKREVAEEVQQLALKHYHHESIERAMCS